MTTPPSSLDHALALIRTTSDLVTNVTLWRVLSPRKATYGELLAGLDARLTTLLRAQGIERLYAHQTRAIEEVLAGRDVAIATPTASGKTWCYNLPVLDAILRDPSSRALYLFPTKALAHDQLSTLEGHAAALGLDRLAATYDGDTPSGRRAAIRRDVRIVLSNPDMLHLGVLPYHPRWRAFFSNLRYVVIDEMHQYRGVFGSHVANVLRRLMRICRFYGAYPQFICCSATIANPVELAHQLIDREVSPVTRNGSPAGERHMVFYNPPIVNAELGIRRPALDEARVLANLLLNHDVQTVVFARSRLTTELLLSSLRQDATRAGRDPDAIQGYRGGYLANERRRIERGISDGTVRGVVATNALELGIDIGGLTACIMVGYPGTIASTWQQAGRAGRGLASSAAFMIASSSPTDQYIVQHPDYFFGRSPEHALLNPDNLYVLLNHIKCATYELPFRDETYGQVDLNAVLSFLGEHGMLRRSRDTWHWCGDGYPAADISLRTANADDVAILAHDEDGRRRTIGRLDRQSVPLLLYEGAIYLHRGQQYKVDTLDWETGVAIVRAVDVDYYTEASLNTRIDIERELYTAARGHVEIHVGEVTVTSRATAYRILRLGTFEHLGWGEIDLPEQQLLTSACWVTFSEQLVEALRQEGDWTGEHVEARGPNWYAQRNRARARDKFTCRECGAAERSGQQHHVHHIVPFREFHWVAGENDNYVRANHLSNLITLCPRCHRRAEQSVAARSTLSGLGRVLGHLVPLFSMCDPGDVGVSTELRAPQTGCPTLFVVDRVPAGVGLSESVRHQLPDLLSRAAELLRDCPCVSGCPSCVGPTPEKDDRAKQRVLHLANRIHHELAE